MSRYMTVVALASVQRHVSGLSSIIFPDIQFVWGQKSSLH